MNNPETVAIDSVPENPAEKLDLLYEQQKRDVKDMRSALLDCTRTDAKSVKSAMRSILIMRVYHQIARIIKFTEEMDKIEQKMYRELDLQLDDPTFTGSEALILLIGIQERLQKVMVDSQKLLDPYLKMDDLMLVDVEAQGEEDDTFGAKLLNQTSRQAIRDGAQQLLNILQSSSSGQVDSDD